VGSACVSERRAIEMIVSGAPTTPFLRFGDRVQIQVPEGPFGTLDQNIAASG
jgi:fumarylacetoacetate (FAA) hydrolase